MEVCYKKIFRPWDNSSEDTKKLIVKNHNLDIVSYQDCTISTTTIENEEKTKKIIEEKSEKPVEYTEIIVPLTPPAEPIEKCSKSNEISSKCTTSIPSQIYPSSPEFYPPTFPDYSHLPSYDLLHGFPVGVTPQDAVFMESLAAHGYAMDEYIRVLNQEHQTKLLSSRKQRPKKYKCPHCDVGFSNNGQLKGHIRIHTGERPFRCDEKNCGKTFTRNEELTRHKRIHSGLRPFACTSCGKRFGRKDHLKKHMRTHSQTSQMHRSGLQLVPVVLPASAWASIPPTSGVPMYNPNMVAPGTIPTFPSGLPPAPEGMVTSPMVSNLQRHHHHGHQLPEVGTTSLHPAMYGL